MSVLQVVLNIFFGALAGVFGGLGMGGGTLLIPLLTIFLSFEQKLAQAVNLISFLVMALFSLAIHFKNGYIKTERVFILIFAGVISSICGAFLADKMPNQLLRVFFGIFLCFISAFQAIKVIKN